MQDSNHHHHIRSYVQCYWKFKCSEQQLRWYVYHFIAHNNSLITLVSTSQLLRGFFLSLFSAILFSFYYILAEITLTSKEVTPNPIQLQTLIGRLLRYVFMYSFIPRSLECSLYNNLLTYIHSSKNPNTCIGQCD